MSFRFTTLPWLLPAPDDFTARRRGLPDLDYDAVGAELRALAGFSLTAAQAAALRSVIEGLIARDGDIAGFSTLKLAVLAGSTFDMAMDHFAAAAARHGVALQVVSAGFDQVEATALDPGSALNLARADAALLALDHRWLRLDRFTPTDAEAAVNAALGRLEACARALVERGGAAPILCTIPTPPEGVFGSFDRRVPGAPAALIARANARIVALAETLSGAVLDVAGLAHRIGSDAWFDPDAWFGARLAFSPGCDAAYADLLGRLLGALRGRVRKALVLDLDNTLWGGVVGDDGVDALRLGPGDPAGEAFAALQTYALDLHRRGVLLAVSSKNDDATAQQAFTSHPGMVLKPEHIAVFQANWLDKPSNLQAIARALNISVEALVLVDDNPAERGQVRAFLPEVAVPELPVDPPLFVRTLAAAGYFEAVSFTEADVFRAGRSGAEASRAEVQARSTSLGEYLSSLKMRLTLGPFDPSGRARIAQLINKTNQFNLTTRRRTEAEVAALEGDPRFVTVQARLADKFGDYGMISVLIAAVTDREGEPALEIDTWLMSCRVLGRGIEDTLFAALMDAAESRGAQWIVAAFRPSGRNTPLADLLPRLGMQEDRRTAQETRYSARLGDLRRPASTITVVPVSG